MYQFWLLVTEINPSCGWLPMWLYHEIQRKKNLRINLKYNKYLFSLKIHFPRIFLIFFFFKDKKLRMNICYLKIWGQKIANSRHEKPKKNQLPPTLINPEVIEVFEDWIVKAGGARNAETATIFSLAHICTTREREREGDSLHFAWCRSDCTRDRSFSRGRASGFAPLSSIVSAIVDSDFAENSMHENRLSLRDLLSITLPFSSSSFFLHNTY